MTMRMGVAPPIEPERKRLFENLGGQWWVDLDRGGLPQPILVRLGTSPEGSLVCTGLIIGGFVDQEITARDLRAIKVGEILSSLSTLLAAHKKHKQSAAVEELRRITIGDLLAISAAYEVTPTTLRPGPRGHPREHFENVAHAYRAALVSDPHRPIKRLAEQYHASEATVRRWVQRARDMGLLGESLPGKAGEGSKRTGRK